MYLRWYLRELSRRGSGNIRNYRWSLLLNKYWTTVGEFGTDNELGSLKRTGNLPNYNWLPVCKTFYRRFFFFLINSEIHQIIQFVCIFLSE